MIRERWEILYSKKKEKENRGQFIPPPSPSHSRVLLALP